MSIFRFMHAGEATAYLFPGQGEQHVGMAKELADAYLIAKETMAEADDVLGFGLSQLCFEGPEDLLNDTINSQPAILAASVATLRVLDSAFVARASDANANGPSADNLCADRLCFVAGHSLGEYSALVATGCIGYADGLRLVRERGRLMKEAGAVAPGLMAAVLGLDDDIVEEICRETSAVHQPEVVQVANYNCPGQVVISGNRAAVESAMEALAAAGARKVVPLAVSIASHSPLMAPAANELKAVIDEVEIGDATIPLIGNTTAQPLTSADEIRSELVAQLTGNVRWTASMQYVLDAGVARFVEIGPGKTLASLVKRIERKAARFSVNDPATVDAFVEA